MAKKGKKENDFFRFRLFVGQPDERGEERKQTFETDDEKDSRFCLHTFIWPVDDHVEGPRNTPRNYVNENLLPPKNEENIRQTLRAKY